MKSVSRERSFGSIWLQTQSWFCSDAAGSLSGVTITMYIEKKKKIDCLVSFVFFQILMPNVFLCLKTKSLFWNNWKQNVTALICTIAVCLSDTFTCKWNMIMTEHFLYWSLTFCVESVAQYFKLICIAVTLEWQREETSKTLFYLRTVTWRDAPKTDKI